MKDGPEWDRRQFREAVLKVRYRQQSIHLREKNIVGPTERSKKRELFSARREGPAFFDEDDVCSGLWNLVAARLNCHHIIN